MGTSEADIQSFRADSACEQVRRMRRKRQRAERRRVVYVVCAISLIAIGLLGWYAVSNYRLVLDSQFREMRVLSLQKNQKVDDAGQVDQAAARRVAGRNRVETASVIDVVPATAVVPPGNGVDVVAGPPAKPRAEDPNGRVTSFFGIEVKNKDFYSASKKR